MIEDSPRYARSAQCAAHIVNLLAGDYPGGSAQLYACVLNLIPGAMYQVAENLGEYRYNPSDN